MSTLSEIIQRAFRESQILDIDRQPSTAQSAEALQMLQGIIARCTRPATVPIWLGNLGAIREQKGTVFRDFNPFIGKRAVPQDCFVNLLLDTATEILLPPSPGDGARLTFIDVAGTLADNPLTIQGNGNLVAGSTLQVLSTNSQIYSLMFRRDIANWQVVSTLAATDQMPFPMEFDDMFVIELAIRINPRYGKEISGITSEMYQMMRSRFIGRYTSENSSAAPDNLWDAPYGSNGDTGRLY